MGESSQNGADVRVGWEGEGGGGVGVGWEGGGVHRVPSGHRINTGFYKYINLKIITDTLFSGIG